MPANIDVSLAARELPLLPFRATAVAALLIFEFTQAILLKTKTEGHEPQTG